MRCTTLTTSIDALMTDEMQVYPDSNAHISYILTSNKLKQSSELSYSRTKNPYENYVAVERRIPY